MSVKINLLDIHRPERVVLSNDRTCMYTIKYCARVSPSNFPDLTAKAVVLQQPRHQLSASSLAQLVVLRFLNVLKILMDIKGFQDFKVLKILRLL